MKKPHVASKNHIMSKSQILSRSQIMTLIRVLVISGVLMLALSWQHTLAASTGTEIPTLTLADALDLAARQNPEIVAAKQALELTSSRLRESRGNTKPKISIQGSGHGTLTALPTGTSTSSGGSSVTVTVSQSLPGVMPEPFSVGLSPVELSEISLEEARLDLVKTEQKVVLDTITSYLNVLKLQQLKDLSGGAHEKAARLLDEVESKIALGVAAQLDLLKAQNQLDQATFSLMRTEDDLCSAMRSLALVLGLPAESEFQLTDSFDVSEVLQMKPDEYELEELIAIALENRIEMKKADLSHLKVKASLETTKRSMKPSVNFFANYSHQDTTSFSASASLDLASGDASWKASLDNETSTVSTPDRGLAPKSTSTVGINVSFSLWDGGIAEEKLKQAEMSLKIQEVAKERQKQAITEDVYTTSTALKQARVRLQLAENAVFEAEESFRITEARFAKGAGVATEVIDAAQSLASSESGVVEALFDYYLAQARLGKAIGLLGTEGWKK
jgi:outer membrane protein TolC